MFTVILYYNKRQQENQPYLLLLQEYEFLFTYEQLQNNLILLPFEQNINKVLNDLNHYVRDLSEWKLILFDGRKVDDTKVHPYTIRKDWIEILKAFSKGGKGAKEKGFSGAVPCEIWYLSCWNKGQYVTDTDSFQYSIAQDEDGNNILDRFEIRSLRMCWLEMEDDTVMLCRHDQLRVSCLLLILACNDIPSTFVDGGYLYQANAVLERKEFAAYVMRRQQMNKELQKQLEYEEERAYQERQQTIDYDINKVFPGLFIDNCSSVPNEKNYQKIKLKLVRSQSQLALKVILYKNRAWVIKCLYDFKDKLHAYVTEKFPLPEEYVNNYLNTAGQEILRKEKNDALLSLCRDRENPDNPRKREKELYEREEKVYRLAEETLSRMGRAAVSICSALLIAGVLARPIWLKIKEPNESLRCFILRILSLIASVVLVLLPYFEGCLIEYSYNRFLKRVIKNEHKSRGDNVKKIINSIRKYQYYHALEQKQDFIRIALEQEQRRLLHHKAVLKNAEDSCRRMEQMLGKDEIAEKVSVIVNNIDFGQEPENVKSYWNLPMNAASMGVFSPNTSDKRDLNSSGRQINVIFPFISNFTLHKTPSLKQVLDKDK